MNRQKNPFKILIGTVVIITGIALYAGVNGKLTSLPQEIMGAIAVPIQRVAASITAKIGLWQDKYLDIDSIILENEELKNELAELRKKQIDYDQMKIENDQYESFLNIKTEHPSYEVVNAAVIGRDELNKFYAFTIDQGSKAGIKKNDVVLSSDGVIGVVIEVGVNYSKVSTILSPSVNIAAFVSSTRDTGVVMGSSQFISEKYCTMSYLPKNTYAKEGDIISTTGLGGVFPKDLIIGTIEKIETEPSGNSKYAIIKPSADIAQAKMVFVITNY